MKIEKIHFNKIKVTFTPDDLIEHNLTPDAVKNNSPSVQNLLMNIVRRAEEETGFNAADCRLMVEALAGRDDTMVMYITRIDSEDALGEAMNAIKRKIRLKVKPSGNAREQRVCITFADFEDVLRLAALVSSDEKGELYFYKEQYHLIVPCTAPSFFSEFGKTVTDEKLCSLIAEHGKLVSKKAFSDLNKFFKG